MSTPSLIYPEFFERYISKVDVQRDIIGHLEEGLRATLIRFKFLPSSKVNHSYAEGKWTIGQVFGHMIDTERIMAYRALCISRGEGQSLPGFDENAYVDHANFKEQKFEEMLEHYKMVRFSNILLFKSLSGEMYDRKGVANGGEMNVRAVAYIIVGHELHHHEVLKTKYHLK